MNVAKAQLDYWKSLVYQLRIEFKFGLNWWTLVSLLLVSIVSAPILVVLAHIFYPPGETWNHLAATVLQDYAINSMILIVAVGAIALLLGVTTAWLVTTCDFPGRKFFSWALILPISIPTYIAAYTYAGIFDFTGPVQNLLRSLFGGTLYFDIMTMEALVFILAFALYPYVYLISRAAFYRQSRTILEASRILGKGPLTSFFKIALPLARPAIAGGVFLVVMEVLNDYGAVKYFGIPTFTTGIFRAWFSLGDPDAAIRLATILMLFVFLLMWLETKQRGKAKFSGNDTPFKPMQKFSLSKPKTIAACAACAIPFLFGFLIPVAQLISWSFQTAGQVVNTEFLRLVLNSFMLALIASSLCVAVALFVVYAARLNQSVLTQGLSRFAVLGYSIPGAVIAVGVLIPFNKIDQSVDRFMTTNFDISTGLILTGTLLAVTFAYLVRFLAISFNPIKAGFENMGTNLNEASLSLGTTPLKTLKKVNLPLVKGALLAAAILVFVDVLKELPVTLILRPFNFDTLAIRAFELASDEMVAQSANAALIIILTSVLPVIALSNLMSRGSKWKT